ncbi:MAG: GNAT family N-acetyltransferase [Acidobacteria bacterium]|nr:GNAT family N-acetyltransferase [Acidobacteriota bacterium]
MTSRPAVSIRAARSTDLEALVGGNAAMALETEQLKLDLPTLRAGVQAVLDGRVPGRFWVAEHEGLVVGQLLITYEWSDWRNRPVWWIQSVHVAETARRLGVFRALYAHARAEALAAGAGGLRLYVDETNTRAQAVYTSLGMNGGHYRVFEDMFAEPDKA